MKTLEQVIQDEIEAWQSRRDTLAAEQKIYMLPRSEAAAIADAVRGWMNEVAREPGHGPAGGVQDIQATRIKELEAEVARLNGSRDAYMVALNAIRERFPFLPGENFWTLFQESVCKWTVEKIWFNDDGRLCLTGYRERANEGILESPRYKASECHPTADACRAAIPVEE